MRFGIRFYKLIRHQKLRSGIYFHKMEQLPEKNI